MAGILTSALEYLSDKSEKLALFHNLKRALLPLVIGAVVLCGLLFSSTVAYFIFYWTYVPSVGITRNIYLQFSQDAAPWGAVDLSGANLVNDQPYAAFVEIELPRTQHNLGNFMVSLSLINQFNETVVSSSRPAILTYTSPIISASLTIVNSPLLLTGFKKESETLFVEVMDRFQFPNARAARPRSAMIEIIPLGNIIQVYDAKLIIVAQFEGVRWFMYSHRLVAFALFTSLFFTSSSLFAGLTWFLISLRSSTSTGGNDMMHGTLKSLPQSGSEKKRQPAEDDETMTAVGAKTPPPRFLPSDEARQTFDPVTDIISRVHQIKKGRLSSDSSLSVQAPARVISTITNVKMEEDSTSLEGEDEDETIERGPISEVSI